MVTWWENTTLMDTEQLVALEFTSLALSTTSQGESTLGMGTESVVESVVATTGRASILVFSITRFLVIRPFSSRFTEMNSTDAEEGYSAGGGGVWNGGLDVAWWAATNTDHPPLV